MPNASIRVFEGFPHVLKSQQFDPDDLEFLFRRADHIRQSPEMWHGVLDRQKIAVLFAEPSSRTFTSFQLAAKLLGAADIQANQHMSHFSSEVKGETVSDTISMFLAYGFNYFVLRRKEEHSVDEAAKTAGPDHPVINAGDGAGQHPTQALLDVYTIWREFGTLKRKLRVGLVGDLKHGRTVHSLVYLLSKFPDVEFTFLSPESVKMKEGILDHLREHGRTFREVTWSFSADSLLMLDVLYVTRPQLERVEDPDAQALLREQYQQWTVTPELASNLRQKAIIMHPLPRNEELPTSMDTDPRARWREQMANGLWVRAALLSWIQEIRSGR